MSNPPGQDPRPQWPTLPTPPQGGFQTPSAAAGGPAPHGSTAVPPWHATPTSGPYAQPANPHAQPTNPYAQPANPYATTADPLGDTRTQWNQPPSQAMEVYNPPTVTPAPPRLNPDQAANRRRLAARLSGLTWPIAIALVVITGDWWWILIAIFVAPVIINWLKKS